MLQFQKTAREIFSRTVLAAVLFLMTSATSRADIILTLIGAGMPMGNEFQYTYSVTLTDGSALRANGGGANTANFFTVYDIPGLISGSERYEGALAANSTHTEQHLGITPVTETPLSPENGNFINVTTRWTGPDVSGALDLGTFSFLSTNPLGAAMLAFTGASQNLHNMNLVANNSSGVAGPSASPAPEPSTLLLAAIGLSVVGWGTYWRRSQGVGLS
jgi:hypothetical protein